VVVVALAGELVVGALVGMVVILLLVVTLQTAALVALYRTLLALLVEISPSVLGQDTELPGVLQAIPV
jgi:hypothetical protein